MWCGNCYTPHAKDRFFQFSPQDESGYEWRQPGDELRFKHGRNGNHLVSVFQCDFCIFINLLRRKPVHASERDQLVLCCIRRANLDAMWSRETSTVRSTTHAVQKTVSLLGELGISPDYPALGPFPLTDQLGYGVAIAMLLKSLEPGRYSDHQQFETIRKLRAGYHNVYMSSVEGAFSLRSVGGDRTKHFLNVCPTHSSWFEQFATGCLRRMGQEVRQDRAISLALMHALMHLFDTEWDSTTDPTLRFHIASHGAYCVICFCGSFRGPEVFLVDLFGLRKHLDTPRHVKERAYVIIPLLGRVKNEHGERYHLTPLCAVTQSGLEVEKWVRRLVSTQQHQGRFKGPAFTTVTGEVARMKDYELAILDRIHAIQTHQPSIVSPDVNVYDDYGLSRSFRRGSTSEARSRGVSDRDVDLANRWRSFENAQGRRPRLTMHDHYSDIRLMIPALIRYSSSL